MLREPERGAAEITEPTEKASVFDVFKIPTFDWIILSGALVNFNLYALGTFFPLSWGAFTIYKWGKPISLRELFIWLADCWVGPLEDTGAIRLPIAAPMAAC